METKACETQTHAGNRLGGAKPIARNRDLRTLTSDLARKEGSCRDFHFQLAAQRIELAGESFR